MLIVTEDIDDARRANTGALLMSLNMLIETPGDTISPSRNSMDGAVMPASLEQSIWT